MSMNTEKIIVRSIVRAPQEQVWNCYTSPEHIVNWNFASNDWHCPSASNDLRVGGTFNARMEAKDGSWGFDFIAQYTALNPGNSYTYVMEDGRVVDFMLDTDGDRTLVTISFDPEDQNPRDLQQQGWQAILDNFTRYTEGC